MSGDHPSSGSASRRSSKASSPGSSDNGIAELREAKEAAEVELRALTPAAIDSTPPEAPEALLARLPDLTQALQDAPPQLKRQVFDAFNLKIAYDKTNRRIEISATISQAAADALHNAKDLPKEVGRVTQTDIAGAGFVSRGDARIIERLALVASAILA